MRNTGIRVMQEEEISGHRIEKQMRNQEDVTYLESGLIKVDETYRTPGDHVYVIGDVVSFPALASTSMHRGRIAVLHIAGEEIPPPRPASDGHLHDPRDLLRRSDRRGV